MSTDPSSPAHPVRRVVRWLVIALLAAALVRALMLLAGS